VIKLLSRYHGKILPKKLARARGEWYGSATTKKKKELNISTSLIEAH
jgi:hypothetical protein